MIDVKLLGQFSVALDGRPAAISSRPAQLLLAYLMLNRGAHPRESIANLLWPDSTAANGRANLRHAIWRLRATIGQAHCIECGTYDIAFNHLCDYSLDVATLERADLGPINAWATPDLFAAAQAYGGELLPGFYDSWVVLERERLAAVFEQRMAALLGRLMRERRWSEVLDWAEHWIALGETPEPAYRALMRAHAARGNTGYVAATYRRCQDALREELKVAPSPVTRRLATQLLGSGGPPAAEAGAAAMSAPQLPPNPKPIDQVAFERQRAELYRRAARRSNRLALGALLGMAAAAGAFVASRMKGNRAKGGKRATLQEKRINQR